MQGLNIKVERGQDQQQVLPLQFICQLSFPVQVCQMKMDIGVGNREQSFPTPAGSGDVLALGHLLVPCKSSGESPLWELICPGESELEQCQRAKKIWVWSSKGMCLPCTCAATVLKKCKFGHL